MLIFQPLLLKFPLWCSPLSEGPYHQSPFDIICSLHKQKANPWESVENDRAGWCCYIRVARIATCPYLHLNLSLSHGQQSPFPAGWMSWGLCVIIRLPDQELTVSLSGIMLGSVRLSEMRYAEPECTKVNKGKADPIQDLGVL